MVKCVLDQNSHDITGNWLKVTRREQWNTCHQRDKFNIKATHSSPYKHHLSSHHWYTCHPCPHHPHHYPWIHLSTSTATDMPLFWDLKNLFVNEDHTLLTILIQKADKKNISYTREQVAHILCWCHAIVHDPKFDDDNVHPITSYALPKLILLPNASQPLNPIASYSKS